MKVQSKTNNQVNFTAKFFHTDALKKVAEYSVEHGKFDKLNQARLNIGRTYFRTRFLVDIGEQDGRPFISIDSFVPKKSIIVPQSMNDYKLVKSLKISSKKRMDPVKFAFKKIIKLGNSAPENNMFQRLIGKK